MTKEIFSLQLTAYRFRKQSALLKIPEDLANKIFTYATGVYNFRLARYIDLIIKDNELNLSSRIKNKMQETHQFVQGQATENSKGQVFSIQPEEIPYPKLIPEEISSFKIGVVIFNTQEEAQAHYSQENWAGLWESANLIKSKGYLGTIYLHLNAENDADKSIAWEFPQEELTALHQRIRGTITHELRHLMQSFIYYLTLTEKERENKKNLGGGVGRKNRDLNFSPDGFNKKDPNQRQEHNLRDIEFQTNLGDQIELFKVYSKYLPQELKPIFLKAWIAEVSKDDFERTIFRYQLRNKLSQEQERRLNLLERPLNKKNLFFTELKSNQPLKYQKAVKEFFKAVL